MIWIETWMSSPGKRLPTDLNDLKDLKFLKDVKDLQDVKDLKQSEQDRIQFSQRETCRFSIQRYLQMRLSRGIGPNQILRIFLIFQIVQINPIRIPVVCPGWNVPSGFERFERLIFEKYDKFNDSTDLKLLMLHYT